MNINSLLRPAMIAGLWLFLGLSSRAQNTEVYVVDAVGAAGDDIAVEVRANQLTDAVGVQLSIGWDTTLLRYAGVEDIARNGSLENNFNQTRVDSGQLGFLLFDNSLQGLMLADSSLLFRLLFSTLANESTVTALSFVEEPLRTVVTDSELDSIPVTLIGGQITIDMAVSQREVAAEDARLRAAPNPFTHSCVLRFRPGYAGRALLEVTDAAGRVVLRRSETIGSQDNQLTLHANELSAAGTYIVRITTAREQFSRKVVLRR